MNINFGKHIGKAMGKNQTRIKGCKRGDYKISVLGVVPNDLTNKVSALHAYGLYHIANAKSAHGS